MGEYIKNIFNSIYTVLVGMKITLDHLFRKNVTQQYPDRWHPIKEKFDGSRSWYEGDPGRGDMPPNSRNRLFLDWELCNGCRSCERACPVSCITVDTVKVVPGDPDATPLKDGSKRGLWVTKYDIDFAKCCFCGLCCEPCPTEAIKTTVEFEYSTYNREELKYSFATMSDEMIKEKTEMFGKFQAEKKKKDAAAKAAKAAAAKKDAEK